MIESTKNKGKKIKIPQVLIFLCRMYGKHFVCELLPLHMTSMFNFEPIRFRSSSVKCMPGFLLAVDIRWSLEISFAEHHRWYSRSKTVFTTRSPMCSTLTSNSCLNHLSKFSFAFAAQSLYSLARRFCMFSLRCCLMISSSYISMAAVYLGHRE